MDYEDKEHSTSYHYIHKAPKISNSAEKKQLISIKNWPYHFDREIWFPVVKIPIVFKGCEQRTK